MSQETVKREADTQDIKMEDAPSPAEAKTTKADLEDLFDDDSDQEFASSAPVKEEEDASQPQALYAASIY
jgi:DNA primase small subunit